MNRREASQAGLGILSAVGIDGEVATITTQNPQAFVITTPRKLSGTEAELLREQWKRIFMGSEMAKVPMIVMQNGMELSIVEQKASVFDEGKTDIDEIRRMEAI